MQWKLDSDGCLISKVNGLALDVEMGNKEPGAKLWMYGKNNTPAQ